MPIKEIEGTFELSDVSCYTKSWLPENPSDAKAKIVFIHGFSDHINVYNDYFTYLAEHGIAVFGFDQRGWGRSVKKPADKGNTGPTSQVLAEIAAFTKRHIPSLSGEKDPNSPDVPLFFMGHSMGGGVTIYFATAPEHQDVVAHIRGWILETPFIGFHKDGEPSAIKIGLGRLAQRIIPRFQLEHKYDPSLLCRDQQVCKEIKEDPLLHDTGTLEFYAGLLDRGIAIDQGKVPIKKGQMKSLLLASATGDQIASYDRQKAWFDTLGDSVEDKELKTYEGYAHMLHRDLDKEVFFKDTVEWVLARAAPEEDKAKL